MKHSDETVLERDSEMVYYLVQSPPHTMVPTYGAGKAR